MRKINQLALIDAQSNNQDRVLKETQRSTSCKKTHRRWLPQAHSTTDAAIQILRFGSSKKIAARTLEHTEKFKSPEQIRKLIWAILSSLYTTGTHRSVEGKTKKSHLVSSIRMMITGDGWK
ncbi:hypothetical protein CAEBREN_00659 [Caenorhabditis brenneri]|uniref:Uncharacterized protein n=1 Tax=Caenorhabditis brenneri TaxID=135651 RepID=G0MQN8_CAEBE|nr:hypothetical protein CAEBREN_00659 [Caenorhabditis brenneri]